MIKVELEFKDIKELKLLLKGLSAATTLYGKECSKRLLWLNCDETINEKLTEEEQYKSFDKLKDLNDLLTYFYDLEKIDREN